MDVTESTKELNSRVQRLKSKFPDPVSTVFIDFYCQCQQGCDYLFPGEVRESIRLLDILQWFFDCVEKESPTFLIKLMWQDVVGPTLEEYKEDEEIENKIWETLQGGELKQLITNWDLARMSNGGVNLILRNLLGEISCIEKDHKTNFVG